MLLIIQIVVEVLLCAGVVFLLIQGFGKGKKTPPSLLGKTDLAQLETLLDESREEFQHFQMALDQGRQTLGDMIRRIDDREKALGLLLAEAEKKIDHLKSPDTGDGAEANLRYKDAARLLRQGKADDEIALECGVTEGEVALIKGLLNTEHEPR